ncbi:MAG: DNA-directed RNA polymerases II 24 kDa polypeptide (RNA polymerase II subunit 5) [Chaenotheca gracillima]|nr:MAG: DNA-directed RNA polymerases II 24 kDa polypeptide (RNA polymerase II subunit 5) [Chaenotheca gracillima]
MAEMATPSAATIAAADPDLAERKVKPERPDEEKYKADLAKAEKDHAATMEKLDKIKGKIDLAKPPSKGSPKQQRQQELRSQLSAIRQQQQGLKSSKGNLQEKLKQLDAQLKSRIQEQKTAKSKVSFKSVDEVDREISRLEKQVDSSTMKLVDEKKALADISSLRKQRKGFAGFDEAQKGIDDVKAQIADLRKGLDDPEAKALSEKYSGITKELDEIKAEQDEAYKNINTLRDERTKLQAEQQAKYSVIHSLKDAYFGGKKAFREYENEAYKARRDRQKAERDQYEKEKRRKVAEKKLEEAAEPAYMDEILTAEGLIRYFDPSQASSSSALSEPGKFAAQASRTVDDAGMKGTRMMKKDNKEDEYFAGTGGKKGKKGRKNASAAGASPAATPSEGGKFNLSMGVIEELGKVNVDTPMSQADVPATVEKLKAKLEHWKADQKRQTEENTAKAQKEVERLEAAAASENAPSSTAGRSKDGARKPTTANNMTNGNASAASEVAQEKDAAADVAADLKKANLEDAKDAEVGAGEVKGDE